MASLIIFLLVTYVLTMSAYSVLNDICPSMEPSKQPAHTVESMNSNTKMLTLIFKTLECPLHLQEQYMRK